MNFTVSELLCATAGTLHYGDTKRVVEKICTDTRNLRKGDVFLCLQGKNFDGDVFIEEALRKGAAGIISSSEKTFSYFPKDRFFLQVNDALVALGDLAREWRLIVDPTICALTGSTGKTTTKEMIAYICSEVYKTHATEGNFNNRIGLPLTLLKLREEHEVGIIETGMNTPGELTMLAEICIPDITLITNIGNAHIGNFHTTERLIRAKAEIFEAMPRNGTAIINLDCPHASIMGEAFNLPNIIVSYGMNERADVQARDVQLVDPFGYQFDLRLHNEEFPIRLNVFGRYQVSNALAAAAASLVIGVDPEIIAERLCSFHAPSMRADSQWVDGVFVISDCYNASPDAMLSSLRSLNDIVGLKRRFAVLGDMYELGEHEERYHRIVGAAVAEAQVDYLCTIGNASQYIFEEAERRGVASIHFHNHEEAAQFLHEKLEPNDGLIVKGSRAMTLEKVLLQFKELRSAASVGEVSSVEQEEML